MRAIDGDILEKKLKAAINMCMSIDTSGLSELKAVLEDVEEMPTIEPEIVRCKDCRHYNSHDHKCKVWNHGVILSGFCHEAMKGEKNEVD